MVKKAAEYAQGIRTPTYTGIYPFGQATGLPDDLLSRLRSDDRLKIGNHLRVGVRAAHSSQHIMGRVHVGGPVSQRLIDGIF
jgi:hypothetical protein